jgi:hypothetical protein
MGRTVRAGGGTRREYCSRQTAHQADRYAHTSRRAQCRSALASGRFASEAYCPAAWLQADCFESYGRVDAQRWVQDTYGTRLSQGRGCTRSLLLVRAKQIARRGVPGPSRSLGHRDACTSGGVSWADDAALALSAADRFRFCQVRTGLPCHAPPTLDGASPARVLALCHLLADLRNPPGLHCPPHTTSPILSHECMDEDEDSPQLTTPVIAARFGDELAMLVEEIVADYASKRFKFVFGRDTLSREELHRLIIREILREPGVEGGVRKMP